METVSSFKLEYCHKITKKIGVISFWFSLSLDDSFQYEKRNAIIRKHLTRIRDFALFSWIDDKKFLEFHRNCSDYSDVSEKSD